jgi:hypothetical protein
MNAIAHRTARPLPVPVLRLTNFSELVQFAQMAAKSVLVPPEYRGKPESIMLAVQLGSELGLSPMQAIQNIAVIGSRPAVWGDAMLALVLAHPDCLDVIENVENDTAVCTVKRRGRTPVVRRFSVEDAKIAKLWGKAGPWLQYPDRMLQMRARGFALRDAFPDVLKGLITAEEARDIPVHNGPMLDAVAEPVPTAPVAKLAPAPATNTADWLGDSIPALDEAPRYPFASNKGGMHFRTGPEWITRWRNLISACRHTDAMDKLQVAASLNEDAIVEVAAFDQQAAAEVRAMLGEAIGLAGCIEQAEAAMALP